MIRYYKLFDLLNEKKMKKTDLLEIISSKTLAKLGEGENVGVNIIEKICLFLECQPSDIMEVFEKNWGIVCMKTEYVLFNQDIEIFRTSDKLLAKTIMYESDCNFENYKQCCANNFKCCADNEIFLEIEKNP